MSKSLRSKTLHALFWNFAGIMGQNGVSFLVGIVLARILMPEQFGLVAMLTIFIVVAQSLVDSGFSSALIQKKDHDYLDECSVFYFNILIGVLAYAAFYLAAPWIAAFYDEPLLIPLSRFICLQFLINPFAQIQKTLLRKKLDYKTKTIISLSASLISGVVGVTLALQDFEVYSIATQQLTATGLSTGLLWLASPWRPGLRFSIHRLRGMFSFGSKLLLAGLLNKIFQNIYLLVIGRVFSPAALGFYGKAKAFEKLPSETITRVVSGVMFPAFSQVQDDPRRLKSAVSRTLCMLVLLVFPMMLGMAVVARPLIIVVLTEKWADSIPLLQVMCLGGMLYPLHVANLSVLRATGRSDLFLRLSIIKKCLTIVNILVAIRFGVFGLVVGQAIGSLIGYGINARYSQMTMGYPLREQVRDFAPYLGATLIMASAAYSLNWTPLAANNLILLIGQTLTGAGVYVALCWIFRFPAVEEGLEIVRGALTGRMKKYTARRQAA